MTANVGYAGSAMLAGSEQGPDRRPLEAIADVADDVARMNAAVADFIRRHNGPQPEPITANGPPVAPVPSCYRSDIDRLQRHVAEMGSLVDTLNRIG